MEHLRQALAVAKRKNGSFALLYIDLDGFKPINDTYGHDMGDMLLRQVAARIQIIIRESDLPARLGGDEFAIILPSVEEYDGAKEVAEKLLQRLRRSFDLGKIEVTISASIGIAIYPEMAQEAEGLLKAADQSMYRSKQQGRDKIT